MRPHRAMFPPRALQPGRKPAPLRYWDLLERPTGDFSIAAPQARLRMLACHRRTDQRRYRTNLGGGFGPRVHYSVVSGKNRVFACVRWLCLPYTPQTVHLRMMQPKQWICRRGSDESHCSPDPPVNIVVNEFQLSHKIG